MGVLKNFTIFRGKHRTPLVATSTPHFGLVATSASHFGEAETEVITEMSKFMKVKLRKSIALRIT